MSNSIYKVPLPKNEKILSYKDGSEEKKLDLSEYKKMVKEQIEIPLFIGKKEGHSFPIFESIQNPKLCLLTFRKTIVEKLEDLIKEGLI